MRGSSHAFHINVQRSDCTTSDQGSVDATKTWPEAAAKGPALSTHALSRPARVSVLASPSAGLVSLGSLACAHRALMRLATALHTTTTAPGRRRLPRWRPRSPAQHICAPTCGHAQATLPCCRHAEPPAATALPAPHLRVWQGSERGHSTAAAVAAAIRLLSRPRRHTQHPNPKPQTATPHAAPPTRCFPPTAPGPTTHPLPATSARPCPPPTPSDQACAVRTAASTHWRLANTCHTHPPTHPHTHIHQHARTGYHTHARARPPIRPGPTAPSLLRARGGSTAPMGFRRGFDRICMHSGAGARATSWPRAQRLPPNAPGRSELLCVGRTASSRGVPNRLRLHLLFCSVTV